MDLLALFVCWVIPLVMVSIIHVILHMEEGTHVKKLVQEES